MGQQLMDWINGPNLYPLQGLSHEIVESRKGAICMYV